jgi:hypothetical protein
MGPAAARDVPAISRSRSHLLEIESIRCPRRENLLARIEDIHRDIGSTELSVHSSISVYGQAEKTTVSVRNLHRQPRLLWFVKARAALLKLNIVINSLYRKNTR